MPEPEDPKLPKQQSADEKQKPIERNVQPKEVKHREFSEGRASQAGEEGISLKPLGSHATNPFSSPQASHSPTQNENPTGGTPSNASTPPVPAASNSDSDKS
jgi:hypothetical protein